MTGLLGSWYSVMIQRLQCIPAKGHFNDRVLYHFVFGTLTNQITITILLIHTELPNIWQTAKTL